MLQQHSFNPCYKGGRKKVLGQILSIPVKGSIIGIKESFGLSFQSLVRDGVWKVFRRAGHVPFNPCEGRREKDHGASLFNPYQRETSLWGPFSTL